MSITPLISILVAVSAALFLFRRFRRRRGLFGWNCNINLRNVRLYKDYEGTLRCPKCGETIEEPPGYMKIGGK